jgi:hypothetical protein
MAIADDHADWVLLALATRAYWRLDYQIPVTLAGRVADIRYLPSSFVCSTKSLEQAVQRTSAIGLTFFVCSTKSLEQDREPTSAVGLTSFVCRTKSLGDEE